MDADAQGKLRQTDGLAAGRLGARLRRRAVGSPVGLSDS